MEQWFDLPNDEFLNYLKDYWYINSTKLIGKFILKGNFNTFTDIRNNGFSKIEYPDNPYNKEVEISFPSLDSLSLIQETYYEFVVVVKPSEKRINNDRLRPFFVIPKSIKEITPQLFIEKRKKLYTDISIELADTIRKAIKTLTSDINREPETFIYELLQNADDYKDPHRKTVDVKFTLTHNYLLLTHNGQPFTYQNVYSLTGVNQGDKRDNINAIGFKGIGFKSVFKDSNFALINSGGFVFKFDESSFPKTAKRPWQIIPVWVDNPDAELSENEDFLNAPVSIAIKPSNGNEKLRVQEKSYKNILEKIFKDDRILIFLRWINTVLIRDVSDSEFIIDLNKNKEKWFISTGLSEIDVDSSVREWLNKQIENEEITIPEKFYNLFKTKITFATERDGTKLKGTQNSKIYNYLPTEIDFGFKFLINGDFIPDGSRTELHNNEWNNYLGKIAGQKFIEWLSVLGKHEWTFQTQKKQFDRDYINLIPDFNDPKAISSGRNAFFLESFKLGFISAIKNEKIAFVPTKGKTLESLENMFVDETGISNLLDTEFYTLTGITLKLIDDEVENGILKIKSLIKDLGIGTIYNADNLKSDFRKPEFQSWLKVPDNSIKIIKYLSNTSDELLKSILETESIFLSNSNQLSKVSDLYYSVPKELDFLGIKTVSSNLHSLVEKEKITLKFKTFSASKFFIEYAQSINNQLTDEGSIINFWSFIYDRWDELKDNDVVKRSLQNFKIICKPSVSQELNIQIISQVYLPKELAGDKEVESIINSLNLPKKFFILPKFNFEVRTNKDLKWNEIFKIAKAKNALKDVITELVNHLPELNESLHFKAGYELFKYWKSNKDKQESQITENQFNAIKRSLKIKCGENFVICNQSIISEHYTNDKRIATILPTIQLTNQVSKDYQPNSSFVSDWKSFFLLIGMKELNNEQKIFNEKLDYYIANQGSLQGNHFEIVKDVDTLYLSNKTSEIPVTFDFQNRLSKLKLKSNLEDSWGLPTEMHFPSEYKPSLDLQKDSTLNSVFKYLSSKYYEIGISTEFLKEIGIKDNFCFLTSVQNSFQFYPIQLITNQNYLPSFWTFITSSESNLRQFAASNIMGTIKNSATIESKNHEFKKPNELYSSQLADYIEDLNLLPNTDFTKYQLLNSNLEILLGINQGLNISQCISLFKKSTYPSQEEIKRLNIISIIGNHAISSDVIQGIKLPNVNFTWLPIDQLYTSNDNAIISRNPNNLLHNDFITIAGKLSVKSISVKDSKVFYTEDKTTNADEEIKNLIKSKIDYISFLVKNGSSEYVSLSKQFLAEVNKLTFIKCDELYSKIEYGTLMWKDELSIHEENSKVFFVDELQIRKSEIRKYIFKMFSKFGTIKEKQFNRFLFEETEREIIEELERDNDNLPSEWKSSWIKEVEDFIQIELENTEWNDLIPDLKNILELSKTNPKEKQKLHNLVAKLKLAKQIGVHFDKIENEYNQLVNGIHKYFIHSARGSFAYIHTNEILRMKNEGFMMALDFGSSAPIKIYKSPEEILSLNKSHLLAYQNEKTMEDLFHFCEANKESNKHLLVIDKDNSREKSKEIFKLLNPENDYQ